MCGIAGIWGQADPTPILDMMEAQKHRGPDDEGLQVLDGQGVLGHVRLSIMDPARGHQPVRNETDQVTLISNGMIYNHPELRRSLEGQHQFRSTSDSETVLHLFEDRQQETPHQLDGAFAFGVVENRRLFLARDPIGIKPLYYSMEHDDLGRSKLLFASELKALSRWSQNIREFPAGTYFDSRYGFHPYYRVPRRQPSQAPLQTHVRNLRGVLEEAVAKRLLSDVPLGAFLSGGLDSSIIAALAKRMMGKLHTFSVGIEGSRDLEAARRVARHIGSDHHEYAMSLEEIRQALPEIVYYLESFDQDLVRSAIPCHFCSRLAAREVKVILTGEGADELFAGYGYFKAIQDPSVLHNEMRRSILGLHNVNLQRVDRMTMRHGIEGRVPFLDTRMIELAQTIPPELKLFRQPDGRRIEKWILRKAVEDLLPADIVWRDKEQFDEGSGTVDLLAELVRQEARSRDWTEYRQRHEQDGLRSAEECFYHHLLVQGLKTPEPVLRNVGRWTGALPAGPPAQLKIRSSPCRRPGLG